MYKIASNKDRQEAAIYVFTAVTIIFLPLSTVASIFGMNTNDIRNMNLNQWVYWAAALPLSVVVIFLCLLFASELGNFRDWFRRVWTEPRYEILPQNPPLYTWNQDPRAYLN